MKIHQKLPPGDILIFLTGQNEIKRCCKLLEDKLERLKYKEYHTSEDEDEVGNKSKTLKEDLNLLDKILEKEEIQEEEEEEEEAFDNPDGFIQFKNLN